MIIYKLTSPSGKCYIGKSKKTAEQRFKQHVQKWKSCRQNSKLHCAFDKYQPSMWIVETIATASTNAELNNLEKTLIAEHNAIEQGYNVTVGGDGVVFDKLSEQHKLRISEARIRWFQTEAGRQWKQTLSNKLQTNNPTKRGRVAWNKGKPCPQISKAKLGKKQNLTDQQRKSRSEKMKQRWKEGLYDNRPPATEAQRELLRNNRLGKKQSEHQKKAVAEKLSKTWLVTSPTGEQLTIHNLNEFCKQNGLDQANMVSVSRGRAKQHKGYHVKLVES